MALLHGNFVIFWHIDPLLGNDLGIIKYTAAVLSNGFAEKHVPTAIELQQ
jgi:hypothetical protein